MSAILIAGSKLIRYMLKAQLDLAKYKNSYNIEISCILIVKCDHSAAMC